jgi:multiple sugar transport system substrate-binding protein
VPLPIGPTGQRASMRNGLAHGLWSGSRNPEEAWRWLRHLGSPACQQRVAEGGVVFPAVRGTAQAAVRAQARLGVDSQVFLDTARGLTFPPPIAPRAAEVNDLMDSTLEGILSGRRPAGPALQAVTRQVREITRRP